MREFPEIVCVGAAHWDVIARADGPVTAGADVPGHVERRPGGVALNVAVALARTGRRVGLIAAIGSDPEGDRLAERLAAECVDCTRLTRVADPTDQYVAIEEAGGEIFAAVADCAALETAGAVMLAALGEELTGAEPGWAGTVVLDGNLPPEPLRAFVSGRALEAARVALVCASPAKAARLSSVVASRALTLYANRPEAEAIYGSALPSSRAAAEGLRGMGVARVVVTDGAREAASASTDDVCTALPELGRAYSMTGSGDAFAAAHLVAELDGLDPTAALAAALAGSARHVAGAAE
jgi:pseudouridine kinase